VNNSHRGAPPKSDHGGGGADPSGSQNGGGDKHGGGNGKGLPEVSVPQVPVSVPDPLKPKIKP
jgi:hypothetical protein